MSASRRSMWAGVLHGVRDLRYEQVPIPERHPGDVLVQVIQNGICGSDVHFFEDGKLGPFEVTRPYIPGHEACGVVVEASDDGSGPGKALIQGDGAKKASGAAN